MRGIEESGALASRAAHAGVRCARCGAPVEAQMRTAYPTGDRCASCTRERFNDAFSKALAVFGVNVQAWRLGMTWDQNQALRELCARWGVAFDPAQYTRLEGGSFAGWIGGPDFAPSATRTRYVEVSGDGALSGDGPSS